MKFKLDDKTWECEQKSALVDELKRQLDELISVRDLSVSLVIGAKPKPPTRTTKPDKKLAFDKQIQQILTDVQPLTSQPAVEQQPLWQEN